MLNIGCTGRILQAKLLGGRDNGVCWNSPSKLNLDITNRCNLDCVWCSRHFVDFPPVDMPLALARKAVAWMPRPEVVTLAGFGEPLLYPYKDLLKVVQLARAKTKRVRIISNGLLLKNKIRGLVDAGLTELIVSVDSPKPEVYRRIRGADLACVMDGLRDASGVDGLKISVNAVASSISPPFLDDWQGFISETGVGHICFKPLKESTQTDRAGILSHPSLPMVKHECMQPLYECNITADGCMSPCCTCRTVKYPIVDYDFDNAWNCSGFVGFRKALFSKNFPKYCREWCNLC